MKQGLRAIENASRDEITALQTERLKWTLKHAYENVPMYRRKFDAAGVHPDDCKSLADLAKFPFTTKKDLRDSYPFGMFAVPRDQVARIHASSGTMTVFTFWAKSATMMVSSYWYSNDRLAAPVATSLPLSTNIIM